MTSKKDLPKKAGKRVVKKAEKLNYGMEIINGEEHTVTRDKKGKLVSKSIL